MSSMFAHAISVLNDYIAEAKAELIYIEEYAPNAEIYDEKSKIQLTIIERAEKAISILKGN